MDPLDGSGSSGQRMDAPGANIAEMAAMHPGGPMGIPAQTGAASMVGQPPGMVSDQPLQGFSGAVGGQAMQMPGGYPQQSYIPNPQGIGAQQMPQQNPMQLMVVSVPNSVRPGEHMVVMTPSGHQYIVVVPQGAMPGSQFQICVPMSRPMDPMMGMSPPGMLYPPGAMVGRDFPGQGSSSQQIRLAAAAAAAQAAAADKGGRGGRGRGGRKRKERDANRAPRQPSAYNLFMKDEVARLKQENTTLTHKEAFKEAASNWSTSKLNPQCRGAVGEVEAAKVAATGAEGADVGEGGKPVEGETPADAGQTPAEGNGQMPVEEVAGEEAAGEEEEEEVPAENEEAPVQEAPVQEAPVDEAPVDEAPVDEAPVDEAPVQVPAEDEEAPVDEAPVDEAPEHDATATAEEASEVPAEPLAEQTAGEAEAEAAEEAC